MKKQNNILMPMDDRPMTKEQVQKMIERLESRKSDMDPFPDEEAKTERVTA